MSEETPEGMLFKRAIPVPDGVGVELLLQKWNPGLPDYAIEDMMTSVLRWNGLQSFDELKPDQEILIPTVVPPGLTPRQWRENQKDRPRRKPFQIGDATFEQAPGPAKQETAKPMAVAPLTAAPSRPPMSPAGKPPVGVASRPPARPIPAVMHNTSPTVAVLEMNLRQGTPGPWQASNKPGQSMAGSEVKEQFQRQMHEQIWRKRTMARPF